LNPQIVLVDIASEAAQDAVRGQRSLLIARIGVLLNVLHESECSGAQTHLSPALSRQRACGSFLIALSY
jgi:hypothetical protein